MYALRFFGVAESGAFFDQLTGSFAAKPAREAEGAMVVSGRAGLDGYEGIDACGFVVRSMTLLRISRYVAPRVYWLVHLVILAKQRRQRYVKAFYRVQKNRAETCCD